MSEKAELLVIHPRGRPASDIQAFVGRCIICGLDFYTEDNDTLPSRVPVGVDGVRAIVIDANDVDINASALAEYKRNNVRVYIFKSSRAAIVPEQPNEWDNYTKFHNAILFDADLTIYNPEARRKRLARSDEFIFESLGEKVLQTHDLRWYDAQRYNWESLVDGYEITGEQRYLDTVCKQVAEAMTEHENDLRNCDRVSGLIPALRVYEKNADDTILHYARDKFDEYLRITPRYRGVLANFVDFDNMARSEIIWQVCPGLMLLSRMTGNKQYSQVAMEQYEMLDKLLCDKATGLWHHGVNNRTHTGAFWARGGAFVLLALLMIMEEADKQSLSSATMRAAFEKMARTLKGMQDESGFWKSVLDNPDDEPDSSGTAWITATFERAVRLGYLDMSYRTAADAGWSAVKSRVWDGCYPGHTMGTTVSPLVSYYFKQHINPLGWTHFAFRATCERARTAIQK